MSNDEWVQLKNPRTRCWMKISLVTGRKVYKKSDKPYKGIKPHETYKKEFEKENTVNG